MAPVPAIVVVLTVLLLFRSFGSADSCIWETTAQSSRYSFNLAGPFNGYVHGIRSEDGFYKVVQNDSDGHRTTFLFQLCEHMKFNHDPPICQRCETCGGPEHCGETCSALEAVEHPGYSLCKTLGFSSTSTYSLLEEEKPENGLIVNMTANTYEENCSFAVFVYCKRNGEELPTSVSKDSSGGCHYTATLRHPAGCPVVTHLEKGGLGWFSTLLIVLLCLFIVYMVAATIYRRKALGIIGWEAIPHMNFWRSIPSNIQLGAEYLIGKVTGLYRRATEPSYIRVNE